jgi:GTP cyclohydrolase I
MNPLITATGIRAVYEDRDIITHLLTAVGEDPTREGLLETPDRVMKAWKHWCQGYHQDPASVLKTFTDGAEGADEMVLVSNIPVYSKCEHHLADIFGLAHVAYIPDGTIVGLSKLARVVEVFARRLQGQERLTTQIAAALQTGLEPRGVGVVLQCRHMCMESRGIQSRGTVTTTSSLHGVFKTDPMARAEFMRLVSEGRNGVPI